MSEQDNSGVDDELHRIERVAITERLRAGIAGYLAAGDVEGAIEQLREHPDVLEVRHDAETRTAAVRLVPQVERVTLTIGVQPEARA